MGVSAATRSEARAGDDLGHPSRLDRASLVVAVALYAFCVWQIRRFITDDAYISLRYARNIAEGHGPVWNPGGPNVEGFSNPLLVFAEAVVHRLFGGGGPAFARGLGVVCGLILVLAVWRLARPVVGALAADAGAVLVAASPPLAYWAVGGLETLPFTLAVVVAALLLARPDGGPPAAVGAVLATLPWLRPEGLAIAGALVLASEFAALARGDRRHVLLRRLPWLAGSPLLSQLALQLLRWVWFGHVLPNSVIYKAGTASPDVLLRFLTDTAPFAALSIAGFAAVRGRARLLAAVPVTYAIASLTYRDSVNTYSRLVLAALPLIVLLAASALPGATALVRNRVGAVTAGTAALAAYILLVGPIPITAAAANADRYVDCEGVAREQAGAWLRERTDVGTTFSMGDAGLTPYTARRTHHDLFALNEASIQETGPQPADVLADRAIAAAPDYFVLVSRDPERFEGRQGADQSVHSHEGFGAYQLRTVTGPAAAPCDYHLFIYERTG